MKYRFDTQYGDFIIHNPETGKTWQNHLWNSKGYLLTLTHTGLAHSRHIDENGEQIRLNPERSDFNCVYIRDEVTKEYWNIGIAPACHKASNYKCIHGQEYTEVSSVCNDVHGSETFVVSPDNTYEVWRVTLKNMGSVPRRLSLFACTGFDLNGFSQSRYYYAGNTSETMAVTEANAVLCHIQNPNLPHDNCDAFIAASEPVYAYEGSTEAFIGTIGSPSKPYLLEEGLDCTGAMAAVRERSGILQNKITLSAGEEKTIYYFIGFTKNADFLKRQYPLIRREGAALYNNMIERGTARFGTLRTDSPDEQVNHIMNFWAQKQVSYCMIGKKAVRDNAQIALGMLNFDTALAKLTITECLRHQCKDGHALLTWSPAYREPDIYSDPSVWLILSVCELVKETGDLKFLGEEIPYFDEGTDTVYHHLKSAVNWFMRTDNIGIHGLPRIHHADWNDALNIPDDQAESVFMAMAICWAFEELTLLADHLDDHVFAAEIRVNKRQISEAVNKEAWNGEYYIRAISKFGKVGDKGNPNGGNIYINPQTWGILAGIIPPDRLDSVLRAIDAMETDEGIPLCMPPYQKYDPTVGRMSGMLPGVYENGGIYNHACGFKVMADCKLHRKNHALKTLLTMIPDGKYNPSSITTTEPYVFTNCYLKHPSENMKVGFSWQTGSSAWGLRGYYEGVLGLVRTYEGLELRPCLPDYWDKVSATRLYRGNELHITYINRGGDHVRMSVDGQPVEGNRVPLFEDGDIHRIVAVLE